MSSSRKLSASNIGRQKAMNAAKTKKDSLPVTKNAMTSATSARLDIVCPKYNILMDNVITAEEFQRRKGAEAEPYRLKIHNNIGAYVKTLNSGIAIGDIPNTARAFIGLALSNKKIPVAKTDEQLISWGQKIIDGDASRVSKGGIVITIPNMVTFATVFEEAKAAITAFSNAKTALTDEQTLLNEKTSEANNLILRMWNEIETTYSELGSSAKRSSAREWGVKYIYKGAPSVVSGVITEGTTGLPLAKVSVKLMGSSHTVYTDINGNFTLNTTLYGDLELVAKLKDYNDINLEILMENGGTLVEAIAMVHK